jgi:hypothetical protein
MFKNALSIGAVAVLLCALGYAEAGPSPGSGVIPAIGLSGTLRPLPDGSYLFAGTFTDLRTGRTLSAPQLRFESGATATTTIADANSDSDALSLTVSADKATNSAIVELSWRRNGQASVLNRLDLRLR